MTQILHVEPILTIAPARLYTRGEFEELIGITADLDRWRACAHDQKWTDRVTEDEWWWRYLAFTRYEDEHDTLYGCHQDGDDELFDPEIWDRRF